MSDTEARDQLAQIIEHAGRGHSGHIAPLAPVLAASILAAGWRPPARVVTTVEELDALPEGTVIQDILGATWTLYEGIDDGIDPYDPTNYHWAIGINGNYATWATDLPATVLYEPEEGE